MKAAVNEDHKPLIPPNRCRLLPAGLTLALAAALAACSPVAFPDAPPAPTGHHSYTRQGSATDQIAGSAGRQSQAVRQPDSDPVGSQDELLYAQQNRLRKIMITARAPVLKLLPDDTKGTPTSVFCSG